MQGNRILTYPNFLYIGIARAGSTWLYQVLKEHPDVYVPPAKDLYFFDKFYQRGMEWYLGFFEDAGAASAIGELSHDYYFSREAAERIHRNLPGAKLILCLREPADKLRSAYFYNKTTDVRKEVSFEEYTRRPDIQIQYDYYTHLKHYIDIFGQERLLVVFYEDLKSDPANFLSTVYDFIGVESDFVPPSLLERINPDRNARSESLALLAYKFALVLRKMGLANVVGRVKHSALLHKVLYKPVINRELRLDEFSCSFVQDCRNTYGDIEKLIGRKLPQVWYDRAS